MKFIVKINTMLKAEHIKRLSEEIGEMIKKGVVVLDGKYEYPPLIIDDGNASISVVMKTKIKKPKAGDRFTYNGIEFVALGEEQGGILAVAAELLEDELPFDKENCNDWRKSSLRKYLNEEYIKNFDKADLLPLVSDLTTDSGQKDYGTSEDYIALLSCDLYRKYSELIIPKYNNWWWTITPWHTFPSNANHERIVSTDGSVHGGIAYYSIGVAPACLFNPSIFE